MSRRERLEQRTLPTLVVLAAVPVTILVGLIEGWAL